KCAVTRRRKKRRREFKFTGTGSAEKLAGLSDSFANTQRRFGERHDWPGGHGGGTDSKLFTSATHRTCCSWWRGPSNCLAFACFMTCTIFGRKCLRPSLASQACFIGR